MPPKSIFRQPGAKHFQLVHRSQRDPLIHDPEASQHVLKEFERGNVIKKGKSRADLEATLPKDALPSRDNIGEAAAYGIYFDDTEYDYMQHLRTVGENQEGVESILIEAIPSKTKGKGKAQGPITLIDLPEEVLPSTSEVPRNYESQQAIPTSISGFQPDMDPHLRQVLEALEDDAFVDEGLNDDFFGELVKNGERGTDEDIQFEFREEGIEDMQLSRQAEGYRIELGEDEGEDWQTRFTRFKEGRKAGVQGVADSDMDEWSDGGDTIGTLPQFSVIGGKKRRKGTSDASGYSMSSSSMFRNEGLTTLDERFDQIQKEYESDEDFPDNASDSDSAPELITSREDFDDIMNEFLENYEVVAGKMLPVLPGETSMDKLETIRKALGEAKIHDQDEGSSDEGISMPVDVNEGKDRWDCETILTTYSNLENHPRLIQARMSKSVPKIQLDKKTGLPTVRGKGVPDSGKQICIVAEEDEDSVEDQSVRITVARPRYESKEDKKARKQAVKVERQQRRIEKKVNKQQFSSEIQRQAKRLTDRERTKMRKL